MITVSSASLEYTTYAAFAKSVRAIAFPEGMSVKLQEPVENYIWVALIKAQKFAEFLRTIQVNFYFPEQLDVHCGVGRLLGPRGKINAVYSFTCDEQCRKEFYDHSNPQFLECWSARNKCEWDNPDTSTLKTGFGLCYPYGEAPTEEDDRKFRASLKYFAVDRAYRLYVAPRFPCGHILAVHWEGLRRSWTATDAIINDDDLMDWVATEVQAEVALRHDRNPQRYESLQRESNEKFADISWWGTEEQRVQAHRDCTTGIDRHNLFDMFPPITQLPADPESPTEPGSPTDPGGPTVPPESPGALDSEGDHYKISGVTFELKNRTTGVANELFLDGSGFDEGLMWGVDAVVGANFKVEGGKFKIVNRTTGLFKELYVDGAGLEEGIQWGDSEMVGANYKIENGKFLLRNRTTEQFLELILDGVGDDEGLMLE